MNDKVEEKYLLTEDEQKEFDKYLKSQIQINTDSNTYSLSKYFNNFMKIVGFSTILGVIFGGIATYTYLKTINNLSIYPDVISNHSNLSVIFICFLLFTIFISLGFFSPYITDEMELHDYNRNLELKISNYKKLLYIILGLNILFINIVFLFLFL